MKYVRVKAWTYDLWGNIKDGYVVNDKFDAGEIVFEEPVWIAQNDHFLRKLKTKIKHIFGLKANIRHASIELSGDDTVLYVDHHNDTGYTPIGELEVVEELTKAEKEAIS
jgi:hypothetical protein